MSIFLELGQRPDEPGPPIHGPKTYPADVQARLAADAERLIARYPQTRSALLPLLHLVQSEDGCLTPAGIGFCAKQLGLTDAEVTAVATFYSMYRRTPTGEYLVGVCTNTLCAIMGGDAILEALQDHLGIHAGETTDDGRVTLEHIECNAACDYAPVVMVNWEFFDNQTPSSARDLVDGLRAGQPPVPTRGAPLCTFKKTSRVLAGLPDPDAAATQGASRGRDPRRAARRPGARHGGTRRAGRDPVIQRRTRRHQGGGRGDEGRTRAGTVGECSSRAERTRNRPGRNGFEDMTPLTPVLSRFWDEPEPWSMETYRRHDGYRALERALAMAPDDVIATVKDSGLRGRGGAGFPTGTKWSFIPQDDTGAGAKPNYLVVNADESEPGTCKDIPLMLTTPHFLVEGVIIAAYAIRAHHAFIYVRGEVLPVLRRLQAAVAEAYDAGYLGTDINGSGFDLELIVHAGAGAYICGEETALLDSLEGRRGQPRLRPPFPAVAGLYASPTVVNNVESIASVPPILLNGVDWFRSMGSEKSPGFTLYSLSGHVTTPGQYEAPLGITLRELLDYAGGVRAGHSLKFWTPGGSSTPLLTDEHLDVPLDYEGMAGVGSDAGHQGAADLRRDHLCGARGAALDGVLRTRVVWQVHAVPRGHLLAGADLRTSGNG